jgi:ribonuclease HI
VDTYIYSDSRYALDCVTKWALGWKARGWIKADKKPIMHLDLIEPMFELWSTLRHRVTLEHVAAHTGKTDAASRGNAVADELANAGAAAS